MQDDNNKIRILMAEDDPDDRLLFQDALDEIRFGNHIDYVENGQELLDYLNRKGNYEALKGTPLPGLVLLDLNMPIKDGREALKEIKETPELKRVPIVVLTTSSADEDVVKSYDLGVNSFITKPVTFDSMVHAVQTVTDYWFQVVRKP